MELRWLQISYNPVRTSNHFADLFAIPYVLWWSCMHMWVYSCTVDFTGYPQAHKDGHGHEEGAWKKSYCTCEELGAFLITKCSHYIFLLISPQALYFLVWCCFLKSPCHYKCVHTDMWNFINNILLSPAGGVGLGMIQLSGSPGPDSVLLRLIILLGLACASTELDLWSEWGPGLGQGFWAGIWPVLLWHGEH